MGRGSCSSDTASVKQYSADGVVAVGALERLGIDSATTYRRCRPDGPWRWMLPGVVLLQSGAPTDRQRLQAALVYAGTGALLTGSWAARLGGLQNVDRDAAVHVLVPHARRRRSAGFAVVERTLRLPVALTCQNLPCAPVDRAVLDQARRLRQPERVQALIAEAVQRRLCTATQLEAELAAGSTRGTALVRRELQEVLGGARSVAEVRAKRLARRSGLPEPMWNVRLVDDDGRFVGEPDAWWPDVGLAWEIDSHDYHLSPRDHARTARRNARYAAHGVPFVPTIPSRLGVDEAGVLAELDAAYAAAARGPAPAVRVEGRS